jgi:uracil-DNA glycosylase
MRKLLTEISHCTISKKHLPFAPRPVLQAGPDAKIIIIGQAPELKVQQSGADNFNRAILAELLSRR